MKAITGDSGKFATRAYAEGEIGHIVVRRRAHHRLVQVILCASELSLEALHFRVALLDVEGAASLRSLRLRHLLQQSSFQ